MPSASLDAACRESLGRWGVPAAVVGVLAGGETDVWALGDADRDRDRDVPLLPGTRFRVTSITKPFRATLSVLPSRRLAATFRSGSGRRGMSPRRPSRIRGPADPAAVSSRPPETWLCFAAFHLADPRVARMREPLVTTRSGEYGLGWFHERVGDVDVWSRVATYGGFQSLLALVPSRGGAFVVLTNGNAGDAVRREIADAVLDARFRYSSAELDATMVGGAGLVLDLDELDWSGGRTRLPRLDARPLDGRTFALVGGQWDDERFDFDPAEGVPRFARLGAMLVPRC